MFSPFGEWQLKIENLGEEKDNWGFLEYFAIKFMGNGYDQLDIKCPDQLIYDLSSGICLEQCPKGSFKKLVSPVRELAPVKRDEVRTIFYNQPITWMYFRIPNLTINAIAAQKTA